MKWILILVLVLAGCAGKPSIPTGYGYLCSGDNILVCQHGDDIRACQCVKQDEAERQLGMWDDFEDS